MAYTETELNTIIAEYSAARSAILAGGASYTITSGGSTRTVTLADISEIEKQIGIYMQKLSELNGSKGFVARAGW